jgi:hypothetical protein
MILLVKKTSNSQKHVKKSASVNHRLQVKTTWAILSTKYERYK